MAKLIAAIIITAIVASGVVYSATIMSVRFMDMQSKIEANAACASFYAEKMPMPKGK